MNTITNTAKRLKWSGGYRVFKDGNEWCAIGKDFINLQESDAGFGPTPMVALGELILDEMEPK